jgi:hypothetical protein
MREIVIELTAEQAAQLKELQPNDVVKISGGVGEGVLIGWGVGFGMCAGTALAPVCGAVGAYIGANIQAGLSGNDTAAGRQVSEIVGA